MKLLYALFARQIAVKLFSQHILEFITQEYLHPQDFMCKLSSPKLQKHSQPLQPSANQQPTLEELQALILPL
jgi:hypothetical protein